MRKMRYNVSITLAVLGLAALAACSKPAAPAGDAASSGAAAVSGSPAAAVANGGLADLGQGLKTGAWQMTANVPGMGQPMVTKMCLDAGLSNKFEKLGSSNSAKMDCSTQKASRMGNTIDVVSTCKSDGMTINTKMHMELTGDSSYHQTVEQSYDPPMMKPMTTTVDGKYLGDCGDMKPGDMVMPGGVKINMNDVAAKAKKP